MEQKKRQTKAGSLKHEMQRRIRQRAMDQSNKTRRNDYAACRKFDVWRKAEGISNAQVRADPRSAAVRWKDALQAQGYAVGTVHTYIAGLCIGLGISSEGIARTATAGDKKKSLGLNLRTEQARKSVQNQDIVRFAEMVGGRRAAYQHLTGADFVIDESGEYCVRFLHDKGGKDQLQRIAPEHVQDVYAYFRDKGPDDLIFPEKLDRNLDLHGIRAEHARAEYVRYLQICSTPEGRAQMTEQLWKRYTDPLIGCKAYLEAKKSGNRKAIQAARQKFTQEIRPGKYWLRGDNRRVAILRDRPITYDRLALCCVSVFALSHWRNEVTVKHYML